MNKMDRVPFMTRSGMVGDSGGRLGWSKRRQIVSRADAQGWPGARPGPGHTQAGPPREGRQGEARERPEGGKYFWGLRGAR